MQLKTTNKTLCNSSSRMPPLQMVIAARSICTPARAALVPYQSLQFTLALHLSPGRTDCKPADRSQKPTDLPPSRMQYCKKISTANSSR